MRFILAILLTVLSAIIVQADPYLDSPAPFERLQPAEIRFIQAMLAGNGSYDGLIDGTFGPRSMQSLRATAQDQFGHDSVTVRDLAILAFPFEQFLVAGRWQAFHDPATNMSYLLPMAQVLRQPVQDEVTFLEQDGELAVHTSSQDVATTTRNHNALLKNAFAPTTAKVSDTPDRRITTAVLRDGVNTVYIRSHRRGQGFASTRVQWRPKKAISARIILASITFGPQQGLSLPEDGILRRAMAAQKAGSASVGKAPEPAVKKESGVFSGTAFYINNTDLVTATEVLRQCRGLKLGDGIELTPLENARSHGAVVLTSSTRSTDWLPLASQAEPQVLGRVVALGFSLYDQKFTALTSTHGHIGEQGRNLSGSPRWGLSMTYRAGNLGAPVLDQANRVIAIAVGRPGDTTLPVPKEETLAAPTKGFAEMLYRQDILFDQRAPANDLLAEQVLKTRYKRAIVPVFCR